MESWYDKDEDVFGMSFEDKQYWKSIEARNIIFNLATDGSVMGIEVIKASKVFANDMAKIKSTTTLPKLL